jgi:hypothetical protein
MDHRLVRGCGARDAGRLIHESEQHGALNPEAIAFGCRPTLVVRSA